MKNEKSKTVNYGEYISSRMKFYIALYQRGFVWKIDKIDSFLEEVQEATDNETKIYGGTFYIKSCQDGYEVIDGQQRTTFAYGVTKYINEILGDHITRFKNKEKKSRKDIKRISELESIMSDIKTFEIKLEKEDFTKAINNKSRIVHKAFERIEKNLSDYFYSEEQLNGNLSDISDFIIHFYRKIEFVEIMIGDEYEIHDIFKSINSKGQKLTDWEIIRNDIYKKLSGSRNEKIIGLKKIDSSLEAIADTINITNEEFIQAYLMMRTGSSVNKKNISEFFDTLDNGNSADELLSYIKKFLRDINYFSELCNTKINEEVFEIQYFFKITKEMNVTQVRVISLAALMSYSKKNKIKIDDNKDDECFVIQNRVPYPIKRLFINFVLYVNVLNKRANIFSGLISNNDDENLKLILESPENINTILDNSSINEYNNRKIDSDEVEEAIKRDKRYIKLLMWTDTPYTLRNYVLKQLNQEYEHVFPRSNGEWFEKCEWTKILKDENGEEKENLIDEITNSIGNIILLKKKLNSRASNKIFEDKKLIYFDEASEHKIIKCYLDMKNKDLSFINEIFSIENEKQWDDKLIIERADKISLMVKTSIKNMMNNPENSELIEIIRGSFSSGEVTLKDVYEHAESLLMYSSFIKNYASIENFQAKIRQTMQKYTNGATIQNDFEPLFEKEKKDGKTFYRLIK